jgi:hypothetical protein
MDDQEEELTRLRAAAGPSTVKTQQQIRELEKKLVRTVQDMQRIHQLLVDL